MGLSLPSARLTFIRTNKKNTTNNSAYNVLSKKHKSISNYTKKQSKSLSRSAAKPIRKLPKWKKLGFITKTLKNYTRRP